MHAHQRAKLERYGDTLFCVLRPARYIDETETVEFGEVHVFAGPQFVITVRHGEAPDLSDVRHELEAAPICCAGGPWRSCTQSSTAWSTTTRPVVAGMENDIDEIEDEVFGGSADVSRRVYELTREVIDFQRATKPLVPMLDGSWTTGVDDEERRYLRNVQDHALRLQEQADGFRQLLQNILNVNLTLETKALSEARQAGRGDQEDLRLGGDPVRPHPDRHDLRHELRPHAGAALAFRLPVRPRADGRDLGDALPALQAPRLDLAALRSGTITR